MTINDVKPVSKKRLYFLDNLKAFTIILVMTFHVAMGYTTWDLPWWVNDSQKNMFFDLFGFQVDVYIMPIMFLIAGYFAGPALFNRSITKFWKIKLRRIVLPWVLSVLFIAPFITYAIPFSRMDNPPNYFSFVTTKFFGPNFQQSHFWFLGVLTLFFYC
jgi:fucose 4-O-acetylase-like acetyltransferase